MNRLRLTVRWLALESGVSFLGGKLPWRSRSLLRRPYPLPAFLLRRCSPTRRMRCLPVEASSFGLLDLSVDLSVPEVYAGTDFTLYLHVKNPFAQRVWIRSVELSLPTQLSWKPTANDHSQEGSASQIEALEQQIKDRREKIAGLEKKSRTLATDKAQQREELAETISRLEAANRDDWARQASLRGATVVSVADSSEINVRGMRADNFYFSAGSKSSINLADLQSVGNSERVPLIGSLPKGTALEPGCTDVWTIRLGSSRSPFFIPASFRLQLTVIYGLQAPREITNATARVDNEQDHLIDHTPERKHSGLGLSYR